ncbi:hypothetical protein DRO42_03450 [Candidatus Bathyarchaeota archaeon]|nr:MAG: hypothetical protein DRO42_03450 [Candidatus Bathyarchaeota archaeon]
MSDILSEASYQEFLALLDWFYLKGPIPIIIGGWAVFFYNSYLGSVDIDLVGPSMGGLFYEALESYEIAHGYEEVRRGLLGLERVCRKPIIKDGELHGYVEIDACTYESNQSGFHENPDIKLPYALCADPKLRRSVELGERREAFIPKKPLLFLYKLKALRDRAYDLRVRGAVMSAERRAWLQSKWSKDGSDLIALLDPEPRRYVVEEQFDFNLLKRLIETQGLEFALSSVKELPNMRSSLDRYHNAEREEVEEWVNNLLSKI